VPHQRVLPGRPSPPSLRRQAGAVGASPRRTPLAAGLVVALATGTLGSWWLAPAGLVLGAALASLALADLRSLRLPRRTVYAALTAGAPTLAVASAGMHRWGALGRSATAGCAAFAAFLLLHLASPRAVGFGDVRMAAACAAFLGWLGYRVVVLGGSLSAVLAGAAALVGLATRRLSVRSVIAFGPFLALGTLAAFLLAAAQLPAR